MSKESASIIQSKVFPLVDSTSYYISSFVKAIHSENQGLLVQSIRADLFSDHCVCRECLRGIPSPTYTEEERKKRNDVLGWHWRFSQVFTWQKSIDPILRRSRPGRHLCTLWSEKWRDSIYYMESVFARALSFTLESVNPVTQNVAIVSFCCCFGFCVRRRRRQDRRFLCGILYIRKLLSSTTWLSPVSVFTARRAGSATAVALWGSVDGSRTISTHTQLRVAKQYFSFLLQISGFFFFVFVSFQCRKKVGLLKRNDVKSRERGLCCWPSFFTPAESQEIGCWFDSTYIYQYIAVCISM